MHGVILRKTKVRDSDLIVSWLSDDDRVFATYASHVQGSKSFPNGLELMTIYEIEVSTRPGQSMHKLSNAYHVEQFDSLIRDERANACACAALEAINDICPEDSTVIDLFETLLQSFAVINTAPDISPIILSWFECFLLHQLGALPNLEICSQCAAPLHKSTYYQEEQGFICPKCAQDQSNIPSFVLEAIRKLRFQSIRTTVQNALERQNEKQMVRIVAPVMKFLVSVLCDNSPIKKLSAHKYMADVVLHSPELLERS